MKVHFFKFNLTACSPTTNSTGINIYSAYDYVVYPGKRKVINTDIIFYFEKGTHAQLFPLYGHVIKHGIDVCSNEIESGKHLRVIIFNHSDKPFYICKGYTIANLMLKFN